MSTYVNSPVIQDVGDNATITINYNYGNSGGRHRQASRQRFGFGWVVRFCLYVLRELRQMRQTIKKQNARIEALEKRPVGLDRLAVLALINQAPACTHTCTSGEPVETRRVYPWTFILTFIGLVIGLIWTMIDASGFTHTVIHDNTPGGWIVSSIADTFQFHWRFVLGGTLVTAIPFGLVGLVIDYIRNRRVEVN